MDVALLSGVVRHRKVSVEKGRVRSRSGATDGTDCIEEISLLERLWVFRGYIFRSCTLRVHKFKYEWDLSLHLFVSIVSLAPFFFSGDFIYAIIPFNVWAFYNILFLIPTRWSNQMFPGFGRFKHNFKASIEEFFSPKLLPILSISFALVVLSLAVTGQELEGPPLCYRSCRVCLASWKRSVVWSSEDVTSMDNLDVSYGCGFRNGQELLGYYTMAQTSFLLYVTVIVGMAGCMAWSVADEELKDRQCAEEWLKSTDKHAFEMRETVIKRFGRAASPIRPEGSVLWVFFGVVAALTFTLLGWNNWSVIPPSPVATLLIVLNILTILLSTLILHLGFFGRIIALYRRNLLRVSHLTALVMSTPEKFLDSWWDCRSFVLNEDLSLDYDSGGLAVSASFLLTLVVFLVVLVQVGNDGFQALLEPPGSYCGYACLYFTMCLIRIFTLATSTFEEQHRHILGLQRLSMSIHGQSAIFDKSELHERSCSFDSNGSIGLAVTEDDHSNLPDTENPLISSGAQVQMPHNHPAAPASVSPPLPSSLTISEMSKGSALRFSLYSSAAGGDGMSRPVESASPGESECRRQTIADIISQIREYDPYPCVFGIPVMPALFSTSKFYIFVVFSLLGTRVMVAVLRSLYFY